ncbi:hypothetical protein KCP69_05580 [Salmonella enterica subsp. enterica]|nr:hypothetical protein KCP69_05580 [Salmonella enterica subsp. enterica]
MKLNTGANAEELSDALMEAGAVSITFQIRTIRRGFEPLLLGESSVCGAIPM